MWFLAVFGIVVFAGGSILYVTERSELLSGDAPAADHEPEAAGQALAEPVEAEAAEELERQAAGLALAEPVEAEPADEPAAAAAGPASTPDDHDGDQAAPALETIEIEMVEFGYVPETINLKVGTPVILRFTNVGRLAHEAMVGDEHMQEEFAAAGDHDDAHADDDHHGDVMAVTVPPGETRDLQVVIDEPGTWYMACHLVGHYEQGQVATITVT
jgi:uncharacterized cupredoxin-like copper-binding protein